MAICAPETASDGDRNNLAVRQMMNSPNSGPNRSRRWRRPSANRLAPQRAPNPRAAPGRNNWAEYQPPHGLLDTPLPAELSPGWKQPSPLRSEEHTSNSSHLGIS